MTTARRIRESNVGALLESGTAFRALESYTAAGITIIDRGTFVTATGAITYTATSTAFSPAAGSLLVLAPFINALKGGGDAIFAVTDTIADTGGGAWAQRAICQRTGTTNGQYNEGVCIWTRVIGTAPGASKTVTPTATILASNTTTDGFFGAHMWEIRGQNASPIGLVANGVRTPSTSTYTLDFGAVPAAASAVFGVVHDDNQVGPAVVPPSGWAESDEQAPAWGVISEWAYKNGSSVQAPQWSGFTNSASTAMYGCAIEIKV